MDMALCLVNINNPVMAKLYLYIISDNPIFGSLLQTYFHHNLISFMSCCCCWPIRLLGFHWIIVEDRNCNINYYDKFVPNHLSCISKFDSCLQVDFFLLRRVCWCFFASNFFWLYYCLIGQCNLMYHLSHMLDHPARQ